MNGAAFSAVGGYLALVFCAFLFGLSVLIQLAPKAAAVWSRGMMQQPCSPAHGEEQGCCSPQVNARRAPDPRAVRNSHLCCN